MSKPYISATQLTMYERCGEAYRRRYLEKEKIPPGIAMVKGIGVHEGAKSNFRQKKESHQDIPKKDIVDISVAKFDNVIQDGILLTQDEETIGKQKVVGEAKDRVVVCAGLYADHIAPVYQPQFVEEKQLIAIPSAGFDLMVVMDMADIKKIIADLKITSRKKNQSEVDQSEQLSFYSLAYKALTKQLPKAVRLEVVVDKKNPERQMLEGTRTKKDLEVIVNRINTFVFGLQQGVFVPCPTSSWACDPRYCGYYPTCNYV